MDSFNKKISELYNEEQTPENLPEGFGWDELSEGIYDKMEEPKKRRKFFWMWFTFGGSVVLLAVFFFFYKSGTEENILPTTDALTEIAETKTATNPILSDKTPIENKVVSTENKEQVSTEVVSKNQKSTNQNTNTGIIANGKKIEKSTLSLRKTGDDFKADLTDPKSPVTVTSSLVTKVSSAKVFSKSEQTSKLQSSVITLEKTSITNITKTLRFLPINPIVLDTKERLALQINNLQNIQTKKDQEKDEKLKGPKSKIKFANNLLPHLYGGTLFTSGKYSQNQQRNKHSKWLPGYYAGVEFTVLTYKKWRINLGYEHKFAVQVFDFQNITDTIPMVVEDVLTRVSTYSLDGSTTETRENISTGALRTRNYLNYNTFRSHAFRMTLVRNFELSDKWQLIAGLGGSYNFLNLTEGRTIGNDGNTLDYDSENAIYRKNNWGIDGGFSLAYQIGKVSLRGNFWVEKSLDYSMEPIGGIRPVFYKIGLGMMYSFH